tara:strand:+ start:319 stop:477 length:159 start_codon:yes stop_codon:yes gene_type:complete
MVGGSIGNYLLESKSFLGRSVGRLIATIMIICSIPIFLFWAYGYFMNMTGQL